MTLNQGSKGEGGGDISMVARFSTPFQIDRGASPASCTMGNGVKPAGRDLNNPPHLMPRLKKE